MEIKFKRVLAVFIFVSGVLFLLLTSSFAQQSAQTTAAPSTGQQIPVEEAAPVLATAASPSGNVTVDFKDADIQTVLRVIALKSGMNIVAAENVRGTVTMKLIDVPWDVALEIILTTYGYAYERVGNVISVSSVKAMTEQKEELKKLFETQPVVIEVFTLKYVNAADVANTLKPLLSKRGSVAVLYRRGLSGWAFSTGVTRSGATSSTSSSQTAGTAMTPYTPSGPGTEGQEKGMSKTLVVIDIPPYVEKIRKILDTMDSMPKQVFIETRIVEVRRQKLKDLGFDFSTGTVGTFQLNPYKHGHEVGATSYGNNNIPAPFAPVSDGIKGSADPTTKLFNTGLNLVFKKLNGFQFEVIMHALEEDVNTNVLSAPKIRTLDNQQAGILIGQQYPILTSSSSTAGGTSATATASLDYYQPIGIQLNVLPQVSADGYINMIVHPTVSTITGYVNAGIISTPVIGGTPVAIQYPILQTREAETQIILKSGDTIVMGGLLEDVKSKGREGIPFLKDIPLFGNAFSRDTNDVQKIDLLIFITAYVLDQDSNELFGRDKVRYEATQQTEQVVNVEAKKELKALPCKKTGIKK